MFLAWKEFRRGKRKKLEVQRFEFNLEDNLFQLHRELKYKIYEPRAYVGFYISDPKLRHIHKADVRDRVVHQAISRIIYPIFDRYFIFDSYASRFDRGAHRAVKKLNNFLISVSKNCRSPAFALKCDISKFFDSIDQGVLLLLLKKRIEAGDAFWLFEKIIKSFEKSPGTGLPLGNVTSQLFANIYLNELDQFIKRRLKIRYYLRYCDDFIILGNPRHFPGFLRQISQFLAEQLKLKLHPNKIVVRKFSHGIDFLGYILRPHHILVRTRTKRRIFRRLEAKNFPSYLGVLDHCDSYELRKKLLKYFSTRYH